ncbi:hypothetical protein WNZ14_03480 [Hoeflea sp. AS60]|uniref:hypothetical protein n=1 Tax=Hoeflea sp. AS60 TaxID=3135780 RepID=UPI00316FD3C4
MEDYNFWADLLDTYQSSPDWIKALWIIIPPTFLLCLVGLMRPRHRISEYPQQNNGEVLYTVSRETDNRLCLRRQVAVPEQELTMLLIEKGAEDDT